ncbi:MAG: hypothetical protein R3B57_12425 [Phycisphaerales bacterium]
MVERLGGGRGVLGLLLACLGGVLAAPGCVFYDIERQLDRANETLVRVESALEEVQATNQRLVELQTQLRRLDTIDGSLTGVEGSLSNVDGELDNIEASLSALDEHMASLRGTINSIDRAIPFLTISKPVEEEGAEGEGEPDEGAAPDADAQTGGEPTDAENAEESPKPPEGNG